MIPAQAVLGPNRTSTIYSALVPQGLVGPGLIFAEMALLSDLPVSATVTAVKDTATYRLDRSVFLDLLDEEPLAYRSLTHLLVDRLRHRTSGKPNSLRPGVAVLAIDE